MTIGKIYFNYIQRILKLLRESSLHFRNKDMKFSKEAMLVSLLGFFALPWKRLTDRLHMLARLAFSSQNFQLCLHCTHMQRGSWMVPAVRS